MALESESALSVQALSVQALSVQVLHVQVWRGAAEGRFQTFQVPRRAHQTILDVVTEIQRDQDATLSYRFACRVGMCGSCAMVVNGRPRWTCRTRVSEAVAGDGKLQLEPLRNMPVVKDLTVDMAAFFDKWRDANGHFIPGEPQVGFHVVPPATPERQAADAGIECIGCGVCHSACDVVAWNKDYLGPAPLNRAWTLVNDVRDAGNDARAGAESMTAILFIAQRASAAVLAFAVTVHLATILYAVRGGLTAGEVLARTRDNHWFFAFYVLFVLAVAVHAPIGLRNVLREWTCWHGRSLDVALALFAALLLGLGIRAALAVYVSPDRLLG
jgi:fumarate reductase iron-sulfur subunit